MNYRLAYAIGFHPWEDLADHSPFADKLLELVAREENGHGPAVRAGRSTSAPAAAIWGAQLAQRGWDVTGVDIVEKALRPRPAATWTRHASTCVSCAVT